MVGQKPINKQVSSADESTDNDVSKLMFSIISLYDLKIDAITSRLVNAACQNCNIWIVGNGGSAATADHLEIDLLKIRSLDFKYRMNASSLSSNSAVISAIANDLGAAQIFSSQLMRKGKSGDVAIFISASGSSPNLLSALNVCRETGIFSIGILGFDGGLLLNEVDDAILVETGKGEYEIVENVHLILCHEISKRVHKNLSGP